MRIIITKMNCVIFLIVATVKQTTHITGNQLIASNTTSGELLL